MKSLDKFFEMIPMCEFEIECKTNPDRMIQRHSGSKTKHRRRHSGYTTPRIHDHSVDMKELISECLEPQLTYNDWDDYRDGQRDRFNDRTKLKNVPDIDYDWYQDRIKWNQRLKHLIRRRKVRQSHVRNTGAMV